MFDCIISCDEIFLVTVPTVDGGEIQLVCRTGEVEEDIDLEQEVDEDHDIDMPDCYRGRITAETVSITRKAFGHLSFSFEAIPFRQFISP